MSHYERFPKFRVGGYENHCVSGKEAIAKILKAKLKPNASLVIDTYPGVNDDEAMEFISMLAPDLTISMIDLFKDEEIINEQLNYVLTDDRVFGKMYYGEVLDFIDRDRLAEAKAKLYETEGFKIVYGFGASLVTRGDLIVYMDMARWEIQLRYRKGMGNYKCNNGEEDILRKYKRGYFVEWRIADKHKMTIFDEVDYFIDSNIEGVYKMAEGAAVREGLKQLTRRPFRTIPYFDPGVWGGQWMKKVCGLDPSMANYAWSFDGVPEENSIYLDYGNEYMEFPAMDLVLYQPVDLLGKSVYARFGAEFPIRFDFLDTMEGQNLSLQVHPIADYIRKQFGMNYTQDESYYVLDAGEGAVVYLGLKEGVNPEEMMDALERANRGEEPFDDKKYINRFPAQKHDHFLIPSGTIHCSGSNAMILEISATPYIFTFKLWDWSRLGLDGRPRPVHLKHGKEVIQWDRTTNWVKENLVSPVKKLQENEHFMEERTGLHELEFIETRRYWIKDEVTIDTEGTFNMLNLVEGEEALIESPYGQFEPYTVHYAETVIIPASVKAYTVKRLKGQEIGLIRAYVR